MKPNQTDNDQQLQRDLDHLAEYYRSGPAPEPPDLVDMAVLGAAKRDLLTPGRRRWPGLRWLPALATAGVMVLALGVVMQQLGRAPQTGDMPLPAPAQNKTDNLPTAKIGVLSEQEASELLDKEDVDGRREDAAEEIEASRQSRSQLPAPPPRLVLPSVDELKRASEPVSADQPMESRAGQAVLREPAGQSGDEKSKDESYYRTTGQVGLETQEAASGPAFSDPDTNETTSMEADDMVAAAPLPETEMVPFDYELDPPPADVWLRRILRWKRLQQHERFERELRAFREIYPDYELPPELTDS